MYPGWFRQRYNASSPVLYQGFGLFAFHSSSESLVPFYGSKTTLQYSEFCKNSSFNPDWMLGAGMAYRNVLCSSSLRIVQVTTSLSAGVSVIIWFASLVCLFRLQNCIAEKIISNCTMIAALLLSLGLIIWGWSVQPKLYLLSPVSNAKQSCQNSTEDWSCWFYGTPFWLGIVATFVLTLTGYFSSKGRMAKIKQLHKLQQEQVSALVVSTRQEQQQNSSHFSRICTPTAPLNEFQVEKNMYSNRPHGAMV